MKAHSSNGSILEAIQKSSRPTLSFEVFPPRQEGDFEKLISLTLPRLVKLRPDFISVTCSPRGKNCARVAEIATIIERTHGIKALAHVTCQWADREAMQAVLDNLKELGIANVLAVRGDPIDPEECKSDFPYASRLVEYIRDACYPFCVAVSAYPEGRDGGSVAEEIQLLRQKVKVGADFSISQLFLDNQAYLSFVRRAARDGLRLPILAGIMPIVTEKARRFALKCGPQVGPNYADVIKEDDCEELRHQGIEAAARQALELDRAGVDGIHWYVLNDAGPIEAILARAAEHASAS